MTPKAKRHTDEFELLCERCGYSVEGLPTESNCPECGHAIADSLPEARRGTPWQRRPSPLAWGKTLALALILPAQMVCELRLESAGARGLQRVNLLVASTLVALNAGYGEFRFNLLGSLGLNRPLGLTDAPAWLKALAVAVVALIGCYAVLQGLTAVERWGVQFFGRVHRRRITPTLARVLTAHASAGWIAAALLLTIGNITGGVLYRHAMTANVGGGRAVMMLSPALLALVGGFLGMLWFECLVYLGVLRRRYANRPKPHPAPQPAAGPEPA